MRLGSFIQCLLGSLACDIQSLSIPLYKDFNVCLTRTLILLGSFDNILGCLALDTFIRMIN